MKKLLLILSFGLPIVSNAQLIGQVTLVPNGCEKDKSCKISTDIKFIDSKKVAWFAPANTPTDGATLPELLEPLIEKVVVQRYEPQIMKAVVLHDHYCAKHVRPWLQTNRMFYEALLESGVNQTKAKLMYAGVLVGSNIWTTTVQGIKCGHECVFSNVSTVITSDVKPKEDPKSQSYAQNFSTLENIIENNNEISLEEIEKKASQLKPEIKQTFNEPSINNIDFEEFLRE